MVKESKGRRVAARKHEPRPTNVHRRRLHMEANGAIATVDSGPYLQKQTPTLGEENRRGLWTSLLPVLAFQGLRQTGRLTSWGGGSGAGLFITKPASVCKVCREKGRRSSSTEAGSGQLAAGRTEFRISNGEYRISNVPDSITQEPKRLNGRGTGQRAALSCTDV